MLHFLRQMLETFRSITPETVASQANFKLTAILIREMADKLNMTTSLAAEIVGQMEIKVDTDEYNAHPELFNDIAVSMVGVMRAMLDAYTKEFDERTAFSMLESAAKGMSLTYG